MGKTKSSKQRISIGTRAVKLLGSAGFFIFVLALFIIQSGWLAISSTFPQAYDEVYHFGIIRFYSHQWLPFVSHQPASTYAYGELIRDPAYLYHYLMSFPYRFIVLLTSNEHVAIVGLRFINIAIYVKHRKQLVIAYMSPDFSEFFNMAQRNRSFTLT